jgi:hypothetical protein
MGKLCELCLDCDDTICTGKKCYKNDGSPCIIEEKCRTKGCEEIGGFIGKIPIFDLPGFDEFMSRYKSSR